jgi:hypothetical protein
LPEHLDEKARCLFDRVLALAAQDHFLRVDEIRVEDRDRELVSRDHLQRRDAVRENDRRRYRPAQILMQPVLDNDRRTGRDRAEVDPRHVRKVGADVHRRGQQWRWLARLENQIDDEPLVQGHEVSLT